MDYRKESGQRMASSQGILPPNSSTSSGLNAPAPGPARPVLNYSIQTGEEFALEFMRDRAMSKMPSAPLPVTAPAPAQVPVPPQTGYMDLRGILGVCRTGSEANSDISTLSASIENPNPNPQTGTENKPFFSSTRSAPAPCPPRAMSGYTSSEAASDTSGSRRVKFLCSYGGKILPRPSDGKLRYVGGETHIIRINYNISFQELKRKTTAIYYLPHTIKYQLPGEDLDALISVSNDEDLRNMMEECGVLLEGSSEGGGGSQKLRMFLFSSGDFDDSSMSLGSMDGESEAQFFAAINGLDTGSGTGKPASGYGLTGSTQGAELDQFMHLSSNIDRQKTSGGGIDTSTVPTNQNQAKGQVQPSLSSELETSLYSYPSERFQYMDTVRTYSSVNPSESLHQYHTATLDSSPISVPSDFGYLSQYAPHTVTGISAVVPPPMTQVVHEKEVALPKEAETHSAPPLPVQAPALVKEDLASLLLPKDNNPKHVENASPPILKQSDGKNNEVNSEEVRYSSGGAFNSGYSDHDTDVVDHIQGKNQPRPARVFHSERIPREQSESLNRLSKSDDSLGSQFLVINTSRSDAVRDSIAEVVDPTLEEISTSSQPLGAEPANQEDFLKFENYENTPLPQMHFENRAVTEQNVVAGEATYHRSEDRGKVMPAPVPAQDSLKAEIHDPYLLKPKQNDHTFERDGPASASNLAWPEDASPKTNMSSFSQEESLAEKKDILVDINDRFPPDFLSEFFSKAKLAAESSRSPFLKEEAGLSVNIRNHDQKSWSFFRNLAPEEFARKDMSLMDQDINLGQMASQIQFDAEMKLPEASRRDIEDSAGVDAFHVNNDLFVNVGENLGLPASEYEEIKLEEGPAEPLLDASLGDINLSNLQFIKNDDLEELRELGSGTFGTVYHGKWRGTDVAIKRIKKSCFTGRSSEQERLTHEFWREAAILSSLHHPNVVAFYGVVQDGPGGTMATVTEFMVNGSLRHVLQRKDKYLDRRKRLIIAMDAAFGMEYLHSKNIVHFDLKCDNLLVNLKDQTRPICKVGDFGLSKIKRNTLVSGGVRGTLPWMAPELLNGSSNKVSEKVDVFSFGIVMWEILTGEEPYANMHYGAIIGGIVNNTLRPPVPPNCDSGWKRLMEQCWAPDPFQRPSFTEIAATLRAMSVAITAQTKQTK
ncbi:kinase superfamily with octicosapeptide/Phox/Bem1p domain-containing protein [Rhynchospora pubera]|uniref:Kinase superfamily with octicosapeptide/Phox/Bem1p domain-containing protein n=1 Tax=Rhynchospora pubera TaxID=906938 RepID=A0AAV8EE10_9POAL|nr:kinase superfamily with octicosapeptide/Phox/Bem1p domain-containing protein [Rhynchospora pubera]